MKKRIAFLVSSLNTGGAQRMVSNIVMDFTDDWEIDLILNSRAKIVYPYKGNIIDMGLGEPKNRSSIIYQGRVFFRRLSLLKKLKKEKNYEAVISFLDSANIVNIISGNKHCKTIISVRTRLSGYTDFTYKYIVGTLVKLFYNKADKIVSISEGVRDDLIRNYGIKEDKVITIYNCYDVEDIQAKSFQNSHIISEKKNALTISTMGRLTHAKGQWHLIRAFSEVLKEIPDAKLYILGDGELKDFLQTLTRKLNIEEHVQFCGFCENPFATVAKTDIFVFPSLYEGFGNALVEAMSCGVPCIASDFQFGAREIFQLHPDITERCKKIEYLDYGILCPICSYEQNDYSKALENGERELKEAIVELYKNDALRKEYSDKAIAGAKRFTAEETVAAWIELL